MNKIRKPFFSIVTISFNQAIFIKDCIESVLNQSFKDFEYIIQDPGSIDNSRNIIRSFNDQRLKFFFEKDNCPADGLNKGFSKASGKFFLFLNSDDRFTKNALKILYQKISENPKYDVYSGAANIIDSKGTVLRSSYSDRFNMRRAVYGHSIIIQPSTTFKAALFKEIGNFNVKNNTNWDGELFIDFSLKLAKFFVFKEIISEYRITENSITGSGKFKSKHILHNKKMFFKVYGNEPGLFYIFFSLLFRIERKLLNPEDTIERIFKGKIFNRKN